MACKTNQSPDEKAGNQASQKVKTLSLVSSRFHSRLSLDFLYVCLLQKISDSPQTSRSPRVNSPAACADRPAEAALAG